MYDVSKTIAQALFDIGKGKSPEPTTLTEEELKKFPVGFKARFTSLELTGFGKGFFLPWLQFALCRKPLVLDRMGAEEDDCRSPGQHQTRGGCPGCEHMS